MEVVSKLCELFKNMNLTYLDLNPDSTTWYLYDLEYLWLLIIIVYTSLGSDEG